VYTAGPLKEVAPVNIPVRVAWPRQARLGGRYFVLSSHSPVDLPRDDRRRCGGSFFVVSRHRRMIYDGLVGWSGRLSVSVIGRR